MPVHGETMARGSHLGMTVEAGTLDWFQRLARWFKRASRHEQPTAAISSYGVWDPRRERFTPLRADAAADLVAVQYGPIWTARIYGGSI
jgi:hypothetical protein